MIRGYICVLTLCILVSITACSNYSGSAYSGKQIRSAQTVERGTVVTVRQVELEEDHPAILGTIAGGALGGVLGNMIGGGRGRILSTVIGAGAGAVGGNVAEKAITKQKGFEIEVKLDNGQVLSIVQGADEAFAPGERVRVLRGSDGSARVTH